MAHDNTMKYLFILVVFCISCIGMKAQPAVGSVKGALTVNDMGAAVYSMTFDAPNGGRMTPTVGLAYNSQSSGYGLAGYGIDVTGISVITSGGRDMFHNGKVRGAKYDSDCNLYLDGKRLVLQEGEDGMDGAVYSPEGDPHTKVTLHGSYVAGCMPVFKVSTKDGGRMVYGGDTGSRFEFYKNGTLCCGAWYVCRAENKYGEGMTYAYTKESLCMRPQSITYGREGALCKIVFAYRQMRQGNERHFRMSSQQGVNDKMLASVTTSINGQTYRRYDFTYDETASDKYSRLTTITESNALGESLNPTMLTWDIPEVNMEISRTDNTDVPQKLSSWKGFDNDRNAGYMTVDLNGDGISDIVRLCSGKRGIEGFSETDCINYVAAYVHIGYIGAEGQIRYNEPLMYWFPAQLANWPSEKNSTISNSLGSSSVMDFDGDGLNDLIFPYYTDYGGVKFENLYILYGKDVKNGVAYSRMQQTSLNLQRTDGCPLHAAMDLNGDGRDDIIALETAGDGGNYMIRFLVCSGLYADGKPMLETSSKGIVLPSVPKHLLTGDYDGDGLADLFVACESGYAIYYNLGCAKGQNPTVVFSNDRSITGTTVKSYWRMEQGDFDGDGQVDFLYFDNTSSKFGIAWNNGDGTFRNQTLPDNWGIYDHTDTNKDDSKFTMTVTDMDGDGKSDVLLSKAMYDFHHGAIWESSYYRYNKTLVRWLHSTGSSFELTEAYEFAGDDVSNEGMFMAGDFNGDGRIETANYGARLDADYSMDASDVLHIYRMGSNGASAGRLASVTDGFGNITTLDYAYATDKVVYGLTEQPKPNTYWEWDEQGNKVRITETSINTYPVNRYTLPTVLVSAVRTQDADIHYTYKDLRLHIAGRGMLGFGTVEKMDSALGITETTEVSKWNLQLYQPQETITTTMVHATGETATIHLEYAMANHGVWYCERRNQTDYDGNRTYMVTGLDDETGLSSGTSEGDGDSWYNATVFKEDAIYDFTFAGGTWHPAERYIVSHHEDDENDALSYEDYTYDDMGNLTSVTVTGMKLDDDQYDFIDGESIRTDYTYDRWGNVTSETFRGNDETIGYKYYEYDPTGRFLVNTYTVPESTTMTYTYDVFGNVLTETDMTNPASPLVTRHEYDAWGRRTLTVYPDGTEKSYETAWTTNGGWYTYESQTAAPWVKTTYDSRGREVKTETVGVKDLSISKTTAYNDKGQVATVTDKYGKRTTTETFTYDARGRVTSSAHSSGAGCTYEYGRNTVTATDAAGRSVTKTYDAWGNVKTVEDDGGTIEYTYYSNGKPHEITTADGTMTMEYDEFGRRTKLVDPDAGTVTTTYDKAGHLLTETDGRGVITTYTYDALGRVTKRRRENPADRYGVPSVTTYTYGTGGNGKERIVRKDCDGKTVTYEYDNLGRVTSETRSLSFCHCGQRHDISKTYTYDMKGQLASVTYPALHSDKGVRIDYSYDGNGYTVKEMHDNLMMFAYSSFAFNTNRHATYWRHGYNYTFLDKDGYPERYAYVTHRNKKEDYLYTWDKTNGNLLSRNMNGTVDDFSYDNLDRLTDVSRDGVQTLYMEYADNGNIESKSDIGDYTYNPSDKPHAVREVEDVQGKAGHHGGDVEYHLNGKAERVCETLYAYGPDDEKWSSYTVVPTAPDTDCSDINRIYWGNYECVMKNSHYREQYFLSHNVILIRDSYSGEEADTHSATLSYYQAIADHLGSITAVYDTLGNKVFAAEYDAWGKQIVLFDSIGLNRGFTGHEVVPDNDLVHMDGRVYDPTIGRFLSPDNYVPTGDTQGFNRYSYCLNNPLKYVDPDGELPWLIPIIAGTINVIANLDGGHGLGYHVANFFVGAGAGVVAMGSGGAAIVGSGALLGVGNYTNNAIFGGGNFTFEGFLKSGIIGGASAAVGSVVGAAVSPLADKVGSGISNKIASRAVSNAVGGAATGGALGAAFSFNDPETSWLEGALNGMRDGALVGAVTGAAQGYYEFRQERAAMRLQNALNGDLERGKVNFGNDKTAAIKSAVNDVMKNENFPQGNGTNTVYVGMDENDVVRYVGITQREPEIRFNEHFNSGTARSHLDYYTIDGTGQLSRIQARIIEQQLINKFGLIKYEGSLFNKINSISSKKWGRYGIK